VHGQLDNHLLQSLQPWQAQLNLLQTMPGADRIGAAMLLVETTPDMSAFGSAERLASWVGICQGHNKSAGKRESGRIRKGNAWVRRLLCEFPQAAARPEASCGGRPHRAGIKVVVRKVNGAVLASWTF
jgi:transposase